MDYSFIIDRVRKVIKSCNTPEQIKISRRYTSLLLAKYIVSMYNKNKNNISIGKYSLIKEREKELIKWAGLLLKKQNIKVKIVE